MPPEGDGHMGCGLEASRECQVDHGVSYLASGRCTQGLPACAATQEYGVEAFCKVNSNHQMSSRTVRKSPITGSETVEKKEEEKNQIYGMHFCQLSKILKCHQ